VPGRRSCRVHSWPRPWAVLERTRPERVTYEYGAMDPANTWRSRREDLERGLGLIAGLL